MSTPPSSSATPPAKPPDNGQRGVRIVIAVLLLFVVGGIALAAWLTRPRELSPAERFDLNREERKIERLTEENTFLRGELNRVSNDYAQLIAEKRCEVIDGMDDCLAAGLKRPERFRESDAELLRQREAEKARRPSPANPPATAAGGNRPPNEKPPEKGTMAALKNMLQSLPGVTLD